jgi:hypothetical protein
MSAAFLTANAAYVSSNPAFVPLGAAFATSIQLTRHLSSTRFAYSNAAFESTNAALLTPGNSPVLWHLP